MKRQLILIFISLHLSINIFAQCEGYENFPEGKKVALEVFKNYQDFMEIGNYEEAFLVWKSLTLHCSPPSSTP